MLKLMTVLLFLVLLPQMSLAQESDFSGRVIQLAYSGADVAFSADGQMAAVYQNAVIVSNEVSPDLLPIILLDVNSGQTLATLTGHSDYAADAAFSPDGQQLISLHLNGDLRVWDVANGSLVNEFATVALGGSRFELMPDGEQIVMLVSGFPNRFFVWNITTGAITKFLSPHFDTLHSFQEAYSQFPGMMDISYTAFDVTSDGTLLVTATQNDAVLTWDMNTSEQITFKAPSEQKGMLSVRSIIISPDDSRIYVAHAEDEKIYVWDTATLTEVGSIDAVTNTLALSADVTMLAWIERVDAQSAVYMANVSDLQPIKIADLPYRALPTLSLAFTSEALVVGGLWNGDSVSEIVVIDLPLT